MTCGVADCHGFAPGEKASRTVGDCYLLGPIAGAVHLAPQAIRDMIHPARNEGFEVAFGNGEKIRVPALTDAELLLGAKMDASHGIWLAVLEKAYGIIRARDRAKKQGAPADGKTIVPVQQIGGGQAERIISLLTGHEAEIIRNKHRKKK